ncbi:unnamed protein product, partial [Didymodactylos carnosus]
MIGRP